MKSLEMIRDALLTVTDKVHHYEGFHHEGRYIVWAEDGQPDSVWADNKMQEQAISGTVDYYTPMEFDPNVEKIQKALDSISISYRLNSIQHEKNYPDPHLQETGFTHYEWVWTTWLK